MNDNKPTNNQFTAMRKKRNIAIGLGLALFIVILYFITIFKLGSQMFI